MTCPRTHHISYPLTQSLSHPPPATHTPTLTHARTHAAHPHAHAHAHTHTHTHTRTHARTHTHINRLSAGVQLVGHTCIIIDTRREPVEGKSSACLICMKYSIISMGKILFSYTVVPALGDPPPVVSGHLTCTAKLSMSRHISTLHYLRSADTCLTRTRTVIYWLSVSAITDSANKCHVFGGHFNQKSLAARTLRPIVRSNFHADIW